MDTELWVCQMILYPASSQRSNLVLNCLRSHQYCPLLSDFLLISRLLPSIEALSLFLCVRTAPSCRLSSCSRGALSAP